MKTVKTTELAGEALNWAVAIALGYRTDKAPHLYVTDYGRIFQPKEIGVAIVGHQRVNPCTNWGQGGPIMDKANICMRGVRGGYVARSYGGQIKAFGRTSLVAGMRCFVLMKLGEEVEVPERLLQPS